LARGEGINWVFKMMWFLKPQPSPLLLSKKS
jgi:hypothetical protein